MGHFAAAPAQPQHVADAPQAKADDQHAEHHEKDGGAGVFAETAHWDGTGKIMGRMPSTGPPCRQRGRPLDTRTSKSEEIMARTRRPLIAGNWKMNGLRADAIALAKGVADGVKQAKWTDREVLVCPPATLVLAVADAVKGSGVLVGGQDCHAKPSGAHTGELSAERLRGAGASHAIFGHSERRADCRANPALVRAKDQAAWRAGLPPPVCIGEDPAQAEAGQAPPFP